MDSSKIIPNRIIKYISLNYHSILNTHAALNYVAIQCFSFENATQHKSVK